MIILDKEVYEELMANVNLANVTIIQGYPTQYYDLPVLSYVCETNNCARKTDGREVTTFMVYKLDLFLSNEEPNVIQYYEEIDNSMSSLGFKRTQFTLINEPNGIHVVFRYQIYLGEDYFAYDNVY